MGDYLIRATAADGNIRAIAATTTALVEEARRRHDLSPTAAAALGRALTAVALLGSNLKDTEHLTLRIAGDGPLGGVTAETDGQGHLRGYVRQPQVHLPLNAAGKLDVGGAVGHNGYVHVSRDLGLKDMYTGSSEIVSGEIGEDITYYLTKSEQTPSAVALGVLVDKDGVRAAGGYLLQRLPGSSEEEAERLEGNLRELGAISRAVDGGRPAEEILAAVLSGLEYHLLDRQELSFGCRCSRERTLDILASLGRQTVTEMLEEDDGAELTCQFCNAVYTLSGEDLRQLLQRPTPGE